MEFSFVLGDSTAIALIVAVTIYCGFRFRKFLRFKVGRDGFEVEAEKPDLPIPKRGKRITSRSKSRSKAS